MILTTEQIEGLTLGQYEVGNIDFIVNDDISILVDFNATSIKVPFEDTTGFGGFDTIHSATIIDVTLFKEGEESPEEVKFDKKELEYFVYSWLIQNNYAEDYRKDD